jgi:hypothetical protein
MSTYTGINGQSLMDVCLNTYGSLDYLYKLLQDSGVSNINQPVVSQQPFTWDSDLIVDQNVNRITSLQGVIYATAANGSDGTYYVVKGQAPIAPSAPYVPPFNPGGVFQYQRTGFTNYIAEADGASVTIPTLIGKTIGQIERNIAPDTEYSFDAITGTITFANPLMTGEKLYIIYTEMITL